MNCGFPVNQGNYVHAGEDGLYGDILFRSNVYIVRLGEGMADERYV